MFVYYRPRDWRTIFPRQRQWALVVCCILHTGRNPSKFRAIDAFRAKFYGPNRSDDVHRSRLVNRSRCSEFYQGIHCADVESRGRCQKDFHTETDKLSAEKGAHREIGPRRKNRMAHGGQLPERYRSISRSPLST